MEWVRDRFPSLNRTLPDGRPVAFLDGPGSSQPTRAAIDAVTRHLGSSMANLGGTFMTSREADLTVDQARRAAADLVDRHYYARNIMEVLGLYGREGAAAGATVTRKSARRLP